MQTGICCVKMNGKREDVYTEGIVVVVVVLMKKGKGKEDVAGPSAP